MKVGVKFCGNCNPHIDTISLYRELVYSLPTEFVNYEDEYELLLVLSACEVDCAARPGRGHPELVVAGSTINRLPAGKKDLLNELKEQLLATFRRMGRKGM
ncbi:MAG: hypothetical protein ACOYBM_00145 [Dethiobacteria bacterium]|jgi:hypothetical protein|nr:hypothetical protein [Bacillota bacterium]